MFTARTTTATWPGKDAAAISLRTPAGGLTEVSPEIDPTCLR